MVQSLLNLWQSTGIYGFLGLGGSNLGFGWGNFVMILVGFLLFYLAIKKGFEPLLLVPIGMGCVLSNIPFAYIASMDPTLAAGAQGATGFIKILFDQSFVCIRAVSCSFFQQFLRLCPFYQFFPVIDAHFIETDHSLELIYHGTGGDNQILVSDLPEYHTFFYF